MSPFGRGSVNVGGERDSEEHVQDGITSNMDVQKERLHDEYVVMRGEEPADDSDEDDCPCCKFRKAGLPLPPSLQALPPSLQAGVPTSMPINAPMASTPDPVSAPSPDDSSAMPQTGFTMPRQGSVAYYDLIAVMYGKPASQLARAAFMKKLVDDRKSWIGLDRLKSNAKALDYGCANGFLSLALAPYVSHIIGIDSSRMMVYNKLAETMASSNSYTMKALWGDLSCNPESQPKMTDAVWSTKGEAGSFDVIAMSLIVDFFSSTDEYDNPKRPMLRRTLKTLVDRLEPAGILLILDIEHHYSQRDGALYDQADPAFSGRKARGYGSKEVAATLKRMGMESVEISTDHHFHWKPATEAEAMAEMSPDGRQEMYFMVKAVKGERYSKVMQSTCTACGIGLDGLTVSPKKCEDCGVEEYCSEECEVADLWIHQKTCHSPSSLLEGIESLEVD